MPVTTVSDQILLALFLGLLAWAALSDGIRFRIPNAASLGVALLYPAHVAASPAPVDWIGGLVLAALLFLFGVGLFARGLVGGGDVKLLSASALWAGPHLILPFLIVMGFTGGLLAVAVWGAQRLRRVKAAASSSESPESGAQAELAERVPYGIAIAAGAAFAGLHLWIG
jgi:prepilin peptidase CpaA